ncbi:HEAT repeat domain-containing protein [candidate division KSB1 bacterium]|nr:MAG: HEAT repeat domain-containing protein [candidate division KSB1 bacterium]
MRTCLIVIAFCLSAIAAYAREFKSAEIDSALRVIGLKSEDFISDRCWAEDDTFLLPKIREALQSPQAAYEVTHEFSNAVPANAAEAGKIKGMCSFIAQPLPDAVYQDIDAQLAAARPTFSDPFEPMLSAFALAEGYRVQAFAGLSPEQKRAMLVGIPMWFEDEDNAADDTLKGLLHRAFGAAMDTTQNADGDSVLTLLSKVNREALSAATYAFARGLAMTTEAWKTTKSPFSATMMSGVDGLVIATRETPYGTFVLGGSGPNVYSGDFALIIDLGGDDRYLNRAGAAVSGLGKSVAAVIDLSGNDQYLSGKNANLGCGILGLGALVDVSGNDMYSGGMFTQGAAFCGAGFFFDGGGDDQYRAGIFGQAAAVCGISVMVDGGGRDVYDLYEYGQGCASTFGAAALYDGGGNDVYRAGGFETHAPLRPEDYRSFAQGFAIGSRPRGGGGFALLHDAGGDDFYNAEIYAQGVGYWYSLGGLIDDAGNDVYNATQYVQGAGIHLAAGVLEDKSGDDRYGSRFGPGQGGAHDLSVALLYDHTGDDQYIISGGQGMAINNSAAIFLDGAGNDFYCTNEADLGQGGVREGRGFGSLAVFADAEGKDTYSVPGRKDSGIWMQGLFAAGYDAPRDSVRPRETEPEVTLTAEDEARSIEDLFKDASRWAVTDNRAKVKRARMALQKKGVEAVRWVGQNKLETLDGLEFRAIVDLFKAFPDSAAPYLLNALQSEKRTMQKNAAGVLGEIKYRPAVQEMISQCSKASSQSVRRTMLVALGEIGDTTATGFVMQSAKSGQERERISAVVSLGKIKDERAYDILFTRVSDPQVLVRTAAITAIAAQGPDIISPLQRELSASEGERLELLLLCTERLAANWKADSARMKDVSKLSGIVKRYLEYPEPRIQGTALSAASEIFSPADLQKQKNRLATSSDPVLRARLRQVELKSR